MGQVWKITQRLVVFIFILSIQSLALKANELEFQEKASELIFSSLKGQEKHNFLKKLYTKTLFIPVWMHEKNISTATKEFFKYMKNDDTLGINNKMLQDALILEDEANNIYLNQGTLAQKVDLEFKISQLYKGYTDYTYFGSINWGAFQARISNLKVNDVSTEWVLHRPSVDPISIAENSLLGESLKNQLQAAIPNAYRYKALLKELQRYIRIKANGGWTPIALNAKFMLGKSTAWVPSLKKRLIATGDYEDCNVSSKADVYDKCLQQAVKNFQARNGLAEDGVAGTSTLRHLNKSVDDRITSIRLNLDRIKWLNKRQSQRHIIINIPDFMLYFEENGKLIQSIKTIVGKPKNPTPIFSDTVETIVLNPYWNIPKSIIQKEMIPKLLRNPNAMARQGIEIHTGWGKDAKKISGGSVDWRQYQYSNKMPFRFAQIPGYRNALGKIKFLFPNKYAVYMHDTPTKKLFRRNKRAFSHGCIRLQKPRKLLETFSTFNDSVDINKSKTTLKGKKREYLPIDHKVPIDVIYLTAWVDYDGKLQFRNDIYHYDKMQLRSFRKW